MTDIDSILAAKGIKPTANRILVMRELQKASRPLSICLLYTSPSPRDI